MTDRRKEDRPNKDEWRTPPKVVRALSRALDLRFNLDPCTTKDNPLYAAGIRDFYTREDDGLSQVWAPRTVFVNPPFSQKDRWITKAIHEAGRGAVVGMLLEAQTDSAIFHEVLAPTAHLFLLRPRLRFLNEVGELVGSPMRGHMFALFSRGAWGAGISALDLRPHMGVRR